MAWQNGRGEAYKNWWLTWKIRNLRGMAHDDDVTSHILGNKIVEHIFVCLSFCKYKICSVRYCHCVFYYFKAVHKMHVIDCAFFFFFKSERWWTISVAEDIKWYHPVPTCCGFGRGSYHLDSGRPKDFS